MTQRFCQILDLKDSPELIAQYKDYHQPGNVWPEIIQSLYDSGIVDMEIYLAGNRLFMILEVDEAFSLDKKAAMDLANEKVQEWEALMQGKFQQAVPWKTKVEWVPAERVFYLRDHSEVEN